MNKQTESIDELRIDRSELEQGRAAGRGLALLAALAVVLAGAGYWFAIGRVPRVRTAVARDAAPAGSSRTVLNASGYVLARRQATVSSKVTGKVVEVLIEEGMKVEENQILARLDDSNVQASLKLAEAQLAAARAALGETRARLELADKELGRFTHLAKENISSAADLDHAQAEAKSLQARLQLQELEASVAERQVALWLQQLEDTVIRAPFGGIAVSKNAQPGEMISPVSAGGGFTRTGIGTVVDMRSLEIEVDVNESYLHRVRSGQPVEATLDAYPDWRIPSRVLAIIPTADRQKSTVKVRVKFDQLDPRILPDMGVKVAFQGGAEDEAAERAVLIPEVAARKEGGRTVALTVKDGRVSVRPITTGPLKSGAITVTSGLKAGESVIIEGPATLAEGSRVRSKSDQP